MVNPDHSHASHGNQLSACRRRIFPNKHPSHQRQGVVRPLRDSSSQKGVRQSQVLLKSRLKHQNVHKTRRVQPKHCKENGSNPVFGFSTGPGWYNSHQRQAGTAYLTVNLFSLKKVGRDETSTARIFTRQRGLLIYVLVQWLTSSPMKPYR